MQDAPLNEKERKQLLDLVNEAYDLYQSSHPDTPDSKGLTASLWGKNSYKEIKRDSYDTSLLRMSEIRHIAFGLVSVEFGQVDRGQAVGQIYRFYIRVDESWHELWKDAENWPGPWWNHLRDEMRKFRDMLDDFIIISREYAEHIRLQEAEKHRQFIKSQRQQVEDLAKRFARNC